MRISDWSSDVCSSDLAEKIGGTDMNRKLLKKLALSGFVLGVATGCSGMGKMADAPSRAAGTPALAAKSADKARAALEAGKADKAVGLAEPAVDRKSTRLNSSH